MSVANYTEGLDSPWRERLSLWWQDRAPKARRRIPWVIAALMVLLTASQHVALAWVKPDDIAGYGLAAADLPVVQSLIRIGQEREKQNAKPEQRG